MIRRWACALIGALALFATPAAAKEEYVYGPEPDWAEYNVLGEAALRAKLPDPENWTVSWPWGYAQGVWSHKGKTPGWLACGIMTTKVIVPGRNPTVLFGAVIDYGQVRKIDISQKMSNSLVNAICDDFTSRGLLPPANLRPAPTELEVARLGMTIRVMPEGAYITRIATGSAADHAGLTPGTVITRANGVGLAGLGSVMAELLNKDAISQLETAVGSVIEIPRAK